MLTRLRVKNYALIKELDINFDDGLSIITGETGAGKSILLGALSLILGNRADTSVLLDKENKCIVEGIFAIEDYNLHNFFDGNEIDYDSNTIIRREITPTGKSRAFINDTPTTINVLKDLGEKLIDIHSQHQTLMLNNNNFQLSLLDSFSNAGAQLEEYSKCYVKYKSDLSEYSELKENYDKNKNDFEYYSFQIQQLIDAKLYDGEQEELENERERLTHAQDIKEGLTTGLMLLNSDNSESILSMLKEAKNSINKIQGFLVDGKELVDRLESTYIELNDISSEIEKKNEEIEDNPERLNFINDRLDILFSLMQKHRVQNVGELIAKREEIQAIIDKISTSDERLNELNKLIEAEHVHLLDLAKQITGKRKDVIHSIEQKVTETLQQLGMPNAKFVIELTDTDDLTPHGKDKADFLFSANKQIKPENLTRTASGGELSRVMLSLKSLLSRNNNLPTIIFDEIDTGVSGEVADKVGSILANMGQYMQVINITHLPQVAAKGKLHFPVYKDENGEKTETKIKRLSDDERVMEIARLLSGSEITDAAITNAKELLGY